MRIVVAPQAFKESLSAREAAEAIARGVRRALPSAEVLLLPVADGGDDTLETLVETTGGEYREAHVTGPVGELVRARWGLLGDGTTAVVEAAEACGMVRMPPHHPRDPSRTTTRGVGELMRHALDGGHKRIIVGVGGSATNDGGAGMAQALGGSTAGPGSDARWGRAGQRWPRSIASMLRAATPGSPEDEDHGCRGRLQPALRSPGSGRDLRPPEGGHAGSRGASRTGLWPAWRTSCCGTWGWRCATCRAPVRRGAWVPGLLPSSVRELQPGADLVCEAVDIERHVKGADLVIVGEGRLDWQTAFNKAPFAVARRAGQHGVPVLALVGSLGPGHERLAGAWPGPCAGDFRLRTCLANTRWRPRRPSSRTRPPKSFEHGCPRTPWRGAPA